MYYDWHMPRKRNDMEVERFEPSADGRRTEVVVTMPEDVAIRFMELYERGDLSQFGLVDVKFHGKVVPRTQDSSWKGRAAMRPNTEHSQEP
jgi:hypothetical protein